MSSRYYLHCTCLFLLQIFFNYGYMNKYPYLAISFCITTYPSYLHLILSNLPFFVSMNVLITSSFYMYIPLFYLKPSVYIPWLLIAIDCTGPI